MLKGVLVEAVAVRLGGSQLRKIVMSRSSFRLIAVVFAVVSSNGCGGSTSDGAGSSTCAPGIEQCVCYGNGTCTAGMGF